jgi:organic radical activating enzyme
MARGAAGSPQPKKSRGAAAAFWPETDGGPRFIVLTGGEPLLQVDRELVDALKRERFFVAVETNGTIVPPPTSIGSA